MVGSSGQSVHVVPVNITKGVSGKALQLFGVVSATGLATGSAVITLTAARVFLASRKQAATKSPGGTEAADAAIIFGGQAFPHGPGRELTARLNHGIALWRDGVVPLLAVSGGPSGDVDEIDAMHRYLRANGVPESAIVDLRPGDNTRITLRSAAVSPLANQRLIGVSTRYHAHRIEAEGRRRGLVLRADCPTDSPEMRNPDALWVRYLSEVIGCVVYASPEWLEQALRRVAGRHRHTAASSLIRQSRRLRRRYRRNGAASRGSAELTEPPRPVTAAGPPAIRSVPSQEPHG